MNSLSQKVYKLSKAKSSLFDGTRGDKNQIFRTLVPREKIFFKTLQKSSNQRIRWSVNILLIPSRNSLTFISQKSTTFWKIYVKELSLLMRSLMSKVTFMCLIAELACTVAMNELLCLKNAGAYILLFFISYEYLIDTCGNRKN